MELLWGVELPAAGAGRGGAVILEVVVSCGVVVIRKIRAGTGRQRIKIIIKVEMAQNTLFSTETLTFVRRDNVADGFQTTTDRAGKNER